MHTHAPRPAAHTPGLANQAQQQQQPSSSRARAWGADADMADEDGGGCSGRSPDGVMRADGALQGRGRPLPTNRSLLLPPPPMGGATADPGGPMMLGPPSASLNARSGSLGSGQGRGLFNLAGVEMGAGGGPGAPAPAWLDPGLYKRPRT